MKKDKLLIVFVLVFLLSTLVVINVAAADLIIVSGWSQVNENGFGDSRSLIQSLEVFNGQLYAGTWSMDGELLAQVWRTSDGHNWVKVPWADGNIRVVWDMIEFNGQLYVGAGYNGDAGDEIWRIGDGLIWEKVAEDGLGDSQNAFRVLSEYSGALYVATRNTVTGIEIWRSTTGDTGSWTQVNTDGFGGGATTQDVTMTVFDGYLYVGFGRYTDDTFTAYTAELWRSNDGVTWTSVFINGAGDENNTNVSAMEEFGEYFYIGIRNTVSGGEVWRSSNGTDWTVVFDGGNGDPDNQRPYGLISFNGCLYLVMNNASSGAEVWESLDGLTWRVIANNGWGDSNNTYADYVDTGHAIFKSGLYLGTINHADGGEIWAYQLPQNFLPLVVR